MSACWSLCTPPNSTWIVTVSLLLLCFLIYWGAVAGTKVTMEGWLTVTQRVDKRNAVCLPRRWTPSKWPRPGWAPPPQPDKGHRAAEALTLITFCQFNYIAWSIAPASLLRPGLIIEMHTKDVLPVLGFCLDGVLACRGIRRDCSGKVNSCPFGVELSGCLLFTPPKAEPNGFRCVHQLWWSSATSKIYEPEWLKKKKRLPFIHPFFFNTASPALRVAELLVTERNHPLLMVSHHVHFTFKGPMRRNPTFLSCWVEPLFFMLFDESQSTFADER